MEDETDGLCSSRHGFGVSVCNGPLSVMQVSWAAPKFKATSYYSVHPLILSATHIYIYINVEHIYIHNLYILVTCWISTIYSTSFHGMWFIVLFQSSKKNKLKNHVILPMPNWHGIKGTATPWQVEDMPFFFHPTLSCEAKHIMHSRDGNPKQKGNRTLQSHHATLLYPWVNMANGKKHCEKLDLQIGFHFPSLFFKDSLVVFFA